MRILMRKKTVLFATTAGNQLFSFTRTIIECINEVRKKHDIGFIIKLHPGDYHPIRHYKKMLKEMNCEGIVLKKENICDVLERCDIIISWRSTVTLDAVSMDKYCIETGDMKETWGEYYYTDPDICEEGIVIKVLTKEDIIKAIEEYVCKFKLRRKI